MDLGPLSLSHIWGGLALGNLWSCPVCAPVPPSLFLSRVRASRNCGLGALRPPGEGPGVAPGGASSQAGHKACGQAWAVAGSREPPVMSPPDPHRVWREELPLRAPLGRRGQRGERDPALGLRVRGPEVLGLLPPLRAQLPVAADQSAAAGGARQDQSGRREWAPAAPRVLMGLAVLSGGRGEGFAPSRGCGEGLTPSRGCGEGLASSGGRGEGLAPPGAAAPHLSGSPLCLQPTEDFGAFFSAVIDAKVWTEQEAGRAWGPSPGLGEGGGG